MSLAWALAFAAGVGAAGCTAAFAPDDDVTRCANSGDCPDTGDERFVSLCQFSGEQSGGAEQVCVAAFREDVNCDVEFYRNPGNDEQPYVNAYDDWTDLNPYQDCDAANEGLKGCRPISGTGCLNGLVENDLGVCDDTEAATPKAVPASDARANSGQDVADQFCRSYFCDDTFVCRRSGSRSTCVPCDADRGFGEGGCGEVWLQGARSAIYQDQPQLDAACAAPNSNPGSVTFGAF
jgi:hypothetical protein